MPLYAVPSSSGFPNKTNTNIPDEKISDMAMTKERKILKHCVIKL
jgi:hypothetical protein